MSRDTLAVPDPAQQGEPWRLLPAAWLLALPALGVHAWMAWMFPSYLHGSFAQDVVFAFAWCGLLACVARWRLLHVASVAVALAAYLAWLFLVLGEGVSYYLQADTFNARFFANLHLTNLATALRAFPVMIGGGIAVLLVMVAVCAVLLAWLRGRGKFERATVRSGPAVVVLVVLLLTVAGVDSAPRRLGTYFTRLQQSAGIIDTPKGHAVARLLDLHPVPKQRLIAAPGKDLVFLYLESLERIYWDPNIFPGLTPNLDRLRKQGLDFSNFQTYSGATYTIAGMFTSQCGVPFLASPGHALGLGGNNANETSFHPNLVCLGDVLHKAGYTQVYMAGAPIVFSHKGLFYRLHGYNQALGLKQLEAAHHGKLPEHGWGLYDSALFPLLLKRYRRLEAAGKPFNLTTITLDTHPPDGRPSPGCPKYAANPNHMLQAVHCTDYWVGKFIAALKQEPDWRNTVVVIMSDHLMMRNDAEALYPKDYHRQPALLVLNAGKGVRSARMYHMDIAPTVLHLMGVKTNATFIAGHDRSAPNAPGSGLVNDPADVAVLRKALWSRAQPLALCENNVLVGKAKDGVALGNDPVPMSWRGRRQVGLWPGGAWFVAIRGNSVHAEVLHHEGGSGLDGPGVAARLKQRVPGESVLLIEPLPYTGPRKQFSIDWIGQDGGRTHLADVAHLRGLEIRSPDCSSLLARMNALPAGKTLDLSAEFNVSTAPLYPQLPRKGWLKIGHIRAIRFTANEALPFERNVGWLKPETFGSWAVGDYATVGFTLPRKHCHAMKLQFDVHPYIAASRPKLKVGVYANGALMTSWHFEKPEGEQSWQHVFATVRTSDPQCRVDLRFVFHRPGAAPPPYPEDEDRRPLQLLFLGIRPASAEAGH